MAKALKPQSHNPRHGWTLNPWLIPAVLSLTVVVRCIMESGKRLMWTDEFFTWYPVSASFGSMLASTTDKINSAPPLYFICTWFWTALFGTSALTLRLFSAISVGAAIFVVFIVLRRVYGTLAAGAALAVAAFGPELLHQSAQARFHTLVIAEVALSIFIYQRLLETRRSASSLLALNAVAHACIVMTHYAGLFYSAAIFCATLLGCILTRKNTAWPCLSIAAGWLAFVPWIPVLLRHAEMGRPTFWIPVPSGGDLRATFLAYFSGNVVPLAWVLVGFALAATWLAVGGGRAHALARWLLRVRPSELALLLVAACVIAVPFAIFLVSTRPGAISIYLSRYMLSGAIGQAIFCAHIAHRLLDGTAFVTHQRAARMLVLFQNLAVAGFLAWTCGSVLADVAKMEIISPPPDTPVDAAHQPVVIEHINVFLRDHFYAPHPERYLFLVDPEEGAQEGGPGPATHQIMAALKRCFPEQFRGVLPAAEFLGTAQSFWVVRGWIKWYSIRVEHNPAFTVDQILEAGGIVHVVRKN